MRPSAHAARRISAAAALLCTGALAAACGSTSSNNGAAASQAATPVSSPAPVSSAVPSAPPSTGATAPQTPPSSPSVPACSTADLSGTVNTSQGGAAAGSTYYPLNLTNTSKTSCYLFGYPGVSFVTGPSGSQIGEPASRNPAVAPRTVVLNPGGTAHVTVQVVERAELQQVRLPAGHRALAQGLPARPVHRAVHQVHRDDLLRQAPREAGRPAHRGRGQGRRRASPARACEPLAAPPVNR